MTVDEARALGWTLTVDGEDGEAVNEDGRFLSVTSGLPLFSLVANIAEAEGQGFALGYGGDQEITPELVAAVSGETYAPEPVPPAAPVVDAASANLVAAVEAVTSASTFADAKANLSALVDSLSSPAA